MPEDPKQALAVAVATPLVNAVMDDAKATQTAASVGQAMALGFGFLGLFSNRFIVFIVLSAWIGAAQEEIRLKLNP